MAQNPPSYDVFRSRDNIRNEIIDLYKSYMELENTDLTKSAFSSFLVEILATLTTNVLFYQISSYREFFLTKAQLPDSIYNLAAFLGYSPSEATAASVNALVTIPFGFEDANTEFTIPESFEFYASTETGSITFSTDYLTTITVTNNSSVSVVLTEGSNVYNIPVDIDTASNEFSFVLPLTQSTNNLDTETGEPEQFLIPDDLQQYQFSSIEVPFSGQYSSQIVEVQAPGATARETWTEISSLFLMDETTKGYTVARSTEGITIGFGNGLIGVQPEAGSTIYVTLTLTEGADGNIISGSLNSGQRIYNTTLAGRNEIVQYSVTNTSAGTGGADEESVEETRRNAIDNLTALERTVSENDYIIANTIIDNSPITQNSLPVLKRSDLKINEITLFTTLLFGDDIVPTRNIRYETTNTTINRNTIITDEGIEYYTIYDMTIDPTNSVANYTYILYEVEQIPTLVTTFGSDYNVVADNFVATREGTAATFRLSYVSGESDVSTTSCEMEILETGATYAMTIDTSTGDYVLYFPDNTIIPGNENTYYFTISHPSEGLVGQYSATFTFRQELEDFAISNVKVDSTGYTVYDIPTIRKSYYDTIDQRDFETQVLQVLLSTLTFKDYRMLTDFVNVKFSSTTGYLNNMQLNEVQLLQAIDIRSIPPTSGNVGDRYIVSNGTGSWEGYDDYIATLTDSTASTWSFGLPKTEQMIYVTNKAKKYIYCESGWVLPEYDIPLQIEIDVFKSDTYTGSTGDLTLAVRNAIMTYFTPKFGVNVDIYRSEFIDVVQEVDGVEHCRLIRPESSIFFNFDINDFTQEELLSYGPEYVYWEIDDITVRIF
jgi:hypothetical protein